MRLASLKRSLEKSPIIQIDSGFRNEEYQIFGSGTPMIFLGYQARWDADQSPIKIAEKSRRIGLSWSDAADSALEASKINGADTYYIGYNKEMAHQYIQDCAEWAKAYNLICSEIEENVEEQAIDDESKDIIAYRITFASGFVIQALSSKPRSIRSKGKPRSRLRIDELAFHDNPKELVDAAIAFKMWGGKIAIWSTHKGKKSYFNQLVKDCRQGLKPFSLHRITIEDALMDGLFQRICYINGETWTQEKEKKWLDDLIAEYGDLSANEELFCIPSDYSEHKFIDRNWYPTPFSKFDLPYCDRLVRFWDLAATQKDFGLATKRNKKTDPCNTVGTLMGYSTHNDLWVVFDCVKKAFDPANTNALLLETATKDGKLTPIAHEQEPGASGIRDAYAIKQLLAGYTVTGVEPQGDKLLRAKGFANASKNGRVMLLKGDWNEDFLSELDDVPFGKMDTLDSCSGAYNYLKDFDVLSEMQAYFS